MLTRDQVRLDRIGYHVDQYRTLDAKNGNKYADRLTRAQHLVESGAVTPSRTGTYLVQGSQSKPYETNGECACQDYQRHAPAAALAGRAYWCKHKIAAKLYQAVEADLALMRPHTHTYRCGHATGHVTCYAGVCPEPAILLCPVCAAGEAETPAAPPEGDESLMCRQCWTAHGQHRLPCDVGCGCHDAEMFTAADIMTQLDYNRDQYEPYQPDTPQAQTATGTSVSPQAPAQTPLPEAPVSLCIKRPLRGGGEMLLTLRGTDETDVLDRFARIADRLTPYLPERCTDQSA
jgi:hypothetical protein